MGLSRSVNGQKPLPKWLELCHRLNEIHWKNWDPLGVYGLKKGGMSTTREKNGKEHEAPCHHKLEECLDEYIQTVGIAATRSWGFET